MRVVHLPRGAPQDCTCECEAVCSIPACGSDGLGQVVCQTKYHTYTSSHELWEQSLCPKPVGSDWHGLECIKGECINCGTHLIPLCDKKLDPRTSTTMKWRRFERVNVGLTKKGESKFALQLEYK
jgi:hypothetical protein